MSNAYYSIFASGLFRTRIFVNILSFWFFLFIALLHNPCGVLMHYCYIKRWITMREKLPLPKYRDDAGWWLLTAEQSHPYFLLLPLCSAAKKMNELEQIQQQKKTTTISNIMQLFTMPTIEHWTPESLNIVHVRIFTSYTSYWRKKKT